MAEPINGQTPGRKLTTVERVRLAFANNPEGRDWLIALLSGVRILAEVADEILTRLDRIETRATDQSRRTGDLLDFCRNHRHGGGPTGS